MGGDIVIHDHQADTNTYSIKEEVVSDEAY
jgi:hypothetical protein